MSSSLSYVNRLQQVAFCSLQILPAPSLAPFLLEQVSFHKPRPGWMCGHSGRKIPTTGVTDEQTQLKFSQPVSVGLIEN